jgi:hypothetical protein
LGTATGAQGLVAGLQDGLGAGAQVITGLHQERIHEKQPQVPPATCACSKEFRTRIFFS